MGPVAAKSFPGVRLVKPVVATQECVPAECAKQEIDYVRRAKGYIFGAVLPLMGEALANDYAKRTTTNCVDFLEKVEAWITGKSKPIYANLDNLAAHRASDMLLFSLGHTC